MKLSEQIKKQGAKAFTHSGKFHADDVFSYALLLYLNPAITESTDYNHKGKPGAGRI